MLSNQCSKLRAEDLEAILKLRSAPFDDDQLGEDSFIQRKSVPLNADAINLPDLLDLISETLESAMMSLTSKDLKSFKDTTMQVANW